MSWRASHLGQSVREENGKGLQEQQVEELPQLETDTVELEHGAEFSEDTLDILRGYERPSYRQELEDSMDPVEDLDDHLAHGIKIPPATYEALQAAGKEEIEGLALLRDAPIDPVKQEEVRYRQRLAEGTKQKDLTWLKTRAYYRGVERIHAERDAQGALAYVEQAPDNCKPIDKEADRRKELLAAAAAKLQRMRSDKSHQGLLSGDLQDFSEESEWPQQALEQQQQLSPALREALSAQLAEYAARRAIEEAHCSSSATSTSIQGTPAATREDEQMQVQQQGGSTDRKLHTVYTEAYLEQQRLSKQVQQQQQQRTMAFWLSLATVSGTYLLKLLRKKTSKGGSKGKGAAQSKTLKHGKAVL